MSLARRHWQIKEHQPGRYVAEYAEKGHSATVAVLYDAQSARVDYVDSQGLLYAKESEGEVIHRNYNTWTKNLANDIKVNLSQAQLSAASAPR
jgi:phage I-like protein